MPSVNRFRLIALVVVALLTFGPLASSSAAQSIDPIILEPGEGRILSLTGVSDPFRTTGMPTAMSQQPGARFEPLRDNCLLQPPEMDLRLIWMQSTDVGYIVTLRFFAPFSFLEELYDQPVSHTLTVIFTPPSGDAITAAVGKSEKVTVKRGKEKVDAEGVGFYTYFTDLVFELPASLGIGPDWVLTTRSRIVADADYCPDPNFPNRYFEITTTPARISALTGEGEQGLVSALPRGMAFENVFHKEYKAIEWTPQDMPAGTRLESLHLEQEAGHLIAVMTLDAPLETAANGAETVTLGLDLVAPGFLGLKHPFNVQISYNSAANILPEVGYVIAPTLRSRGTNELIGSVPVTIAGNEVRVDLSELTPVESDYTPPPLPTGEGYIQELGATAFAIEGTISFEGADGESEPVTVEVVGPAIRFTFADGTMSTGWIDPYDNQFIADGELIAGGLGAEDVNKRCANVDASAQKWDPDEFKTMGLLEDIAALADMKSLHGDDPAWQKQIADDTADLKKRLFDWVKDEKPRVASATGCDDSPEPTPTAGAFVRVFVAKDSPLEKPDWLALLPNLYWDLSPLGIQPIGFGNSAPAPFPFQSTTEWIPSTWGLTPGMNGWGIRGWTQALVPKPDGSGMDSPMVFTPYVAASLIFGPTGGDQATPVALSSPDQAVLTASAQVKRRISRPRRT